MQLRLIPVNLNQEVDWTERVGESQKRAYVKLCFIVSELSVASMFKPDCGVTIMDGHYHILTLPQCELLIFDPDTVLFEPDNRDSHYWFARYWAEALAIQNSDAELAAYFKPVAAALAEGEEKILAELASGQGPAVDLGGYYRTDAGKTGAVMRPSATLNAIIG